ncbi:MAG: thioredoxin [Phycisphaerae bacterium]|nr:thioredoxin [Phycisphaerae bacterium]
MAGNVVELSDASFDETVHNSTVPVLVDFWAPWCGPCRMLAPIIEQVAGEFAGKAQVCKLNTDEARDTAVEFSISAIPTVILFKDGQIQKKWVGLTSKKDISEAISKLL